MTVDVSDINDGRPDFTEDIYEFDILEDTSINSRFSGILANDDDDGSNAEVTYSSNISGIVKVLPNSETVYSLPQYCRTLTLEPC